MRRSMEMELANTAYKDDIIPVPPSANVTFCAQTLDFESLDEMTQGFKWFTLALIGVVVLVILGLIISKCYLIRTEWRWYNGRVKLLAKEVDAAPFGVDDG